MISGASAYMPIFRISNKDAVDIMVNKYDTDQDGYLNIDEAQNVPILSRTNFETADSFGDGMLTDQEFISYLDQMKMEIGQGNTNPMVLLMSGQGIDEDTFAEILEEAEAQESKQTFIEYMNHLTEEYEAAQKEVGSELDVSA
ncbi:hypothetical protein [uncultured Cohaesibacter sp.]|uniref:hypothetical protein n=1 Tax=uncultured Cohaesibacter sp. TaxID=1002546 RepID=UPI00292FF72A|nr:hypothetical protein [uncultured Cohaesibacter sp.]